jgi:hypothetical protein
MTDVMKCPKCGGEMEEGYVRLSEGIRWRTRDRARGEILRVGPFLWPRDNTAHLC